MKLNATIEVPGRVFMVGPLTTIPEDHPAHEGIYVRHQHRVDLWGAYVYVEGVCVGTLTSPPRVDRDTVFEHGKEGPVDVLVNTTTLDVILDLPTKNETGVQE